MTAVQRLECCCRSRQRLYQRAGFDGEDANSFYTKSFFCEEPPSSGAPSDCVIGADAEVNPGRLDSHHLRDRASGISAGRRHAGVSGGSVCLNHPAMVDASRVAGPGATNIPAVPHSHIITKRRGGWWHTVNIRVFNLDVWNQIAAAKSLAKVRELQADPTVGGAGLISQDTPTNIFFFIEAQPAKRRQIVSITVAAGRPCTDLRGATRR